MPGVIDWSNNEPGADVELLYQHLHRRDHPRGYQAGSALVNAVRVALALEQPLLVSGEPGTGKTRLAWWVAWKLGLQPPREFRTKTTSTAADLVCQYDSLSHFRDVQTQREKPLEEYVYYGELGEAIRLTRGAPPRQSVVLVDEIDKAPRDFPNDLLSEIENQSFRVRETKQEWSAAPCLRPVMILTSNSEKSLPDAFLRRCVFYYIEFPDESQLKRILRERLDLGGAEQERLQAAIVRFLEVRAMDLRKAPATAELMAWYRMLCEHEIGPAEIKLGSQRFVEISTATLAKYKEDGDKLRKRLKP